MDESEQQLRRHYERQQLSHERVQAILGAGRAAAAAKSRRNRWLLTAAAIIVVGLGLLGGSVHFYGRMRPADPPPIRVEMLAGAVTDFFGDPSHSLGRFSSDRRVLAEWLHQRGGPAKFEPPRAMQNLPGYGCQVLDVHGQHVYMMCFSLGAPRPGNPATTAKTASPSDTGEPLENEAPQFVHLLVATKSSFIDPPKVGERVVMSASGAWNFTAWTEGDQTFLAAGAMPAEHLARLVAAL